MKHQVGGLAVEGDVADLADDQQRDALQAVELGVEAAVALGVGQRATHSVALLNSARCPARQTRIARAIARWVLPVPGE